MEYTQTFSVLLDNEQRPTITITFTSPVDIGNFTRISYLPSLHLVYIDRELQDKMNGLQHNNEVKEEYSS